MENAQDRLNEAYSNVALVLRNSQDFGLGPSAPPALANILEKTLSLLAEIMQDKEQPSCTSNGALEAELSQDTDRDRLSFVRRSTTV